MCNRFILKEDITLICGGKLNHGYINIIFWNVFKNLFKSETDSPEDFSICLTEISNCCVLQRQH